MSKANGSVATADEINAALGDRNPHPQPPPELEYERDGAPHRASGRARPVEVDIETDAAETNALAIIDTQTRGEVDIQVATALQYPRSIQRFRDEARQLATMDTDTAASCMYAVPRGEEGGRKKFITGPSIRFAEIVAATWGHLRTASSLVVEEEKYVVVRGMAWDCQRNIARSVEVRRSILTKNGKRYPPDMVTMTVNAAASIAVRNAIFAVIPRPYWTGILDAANAVADGKERPIEARRQGMLDAFHKLGVTPAQVFEVLGVAGEADVTDEQLTEARGLYTAIKEGTTTVERVFSPDKGAGPSKAGGLNERIEAIREQRGAKN